MKLRVELISQIEILESNPDFVQMEYVGRLVDQYAAKLAELKMKNIAVPDEVLSEFEVLQGRYITQLRLLAEALIEKAQKFNNTKLVESIL